MNDTTPQRPQSSWTKWRRAMQLIGILLLIWILAQLDMGYVSAALLASDMRYLALYVALFALAMVLRAMRLRWVMARQEIHVGLGAAYMTTVEASLLGLVTPARAGEVSKVFALRHIGVPASLGLTVVLLERIFDLVVFATLAVCGVLYFGGIFSEPIHLLLYVAAVVCAIGLLLYVLRRPALVGVAKLLDLLGGKWTRARGLLKAEYFKNGLRLLSETWGIMLVYSCLIGALGLVEAYCLAYALAIKIDFVHLAFSYSVASIIALLPVSFNGLGTREASYIYLLGLVSVKPESAMLLSLLDGMVLPLIIIALLSIPVWREAGQRLAEATGKQVK